MRDHPAHRKTPLPPRKHRGAKRVRLALPVLIGLAGLWPLDLLRAGLAGAPAESPAATPAARKPPTLRVTTYNIHGFDPVAPQEEGRARLKQVNQNGQLLSRYALELALRQPDVIALQEAAPQIRVEQLARELKMHLAFFPGGWTNQGWPLGIAGALLSRWPIVETQNRPGLAPYGKAADIFSRHFGRVVLDRDGERIAVYTAHLLPSYANTTHIRLAEIAAVAAAAQADRKRGLSVMVMGDMNHTPYAPEYRAWIEAGFTHAFAAKGRGMPLTCAVNDLVEQIDYIFTLGPLTERLQECRVLYEGAFRCHLDDPTTWALSDHVPVWAAFE